MKNRYFTLLALLLSVGLAVPACGGDDDDDNQGQDDDDDDDDNAGNGGNAGNGNNGNAGNGNNGNAGNGNNGNAGNGNAGNGNAGNGNAGGGNVNLQNVYEFTGGIDLDDTQKLFPFGVAIAPNGAVFVSTLGDNVDGSVASRIYKFSGSNTPQLYFEVKNIDNAIYGLTIGENGRLYACIAPHINADNRAQSTIYEFQDLNAAGNVNAGFKTITLQADVIVNGTTPQGTATIQLDQCTNIAFDGSNNLYAIDALGESGSIFRVNINAFDKGGGASPIVDQNNNVTNFNDIVTSAWFNDANNLGAGNGTTFGPAGIAFSSSTISFVRQDDNNTLFQVGVAGNFPEDAAATITNILGNVDNAVYLAGTGDNFLVSLLDDGNGGGNEIVLLEPNAGAFQSRTLANAGQFNNDDEFLDPLGIAVKGNDALVVASQISDLIGVANPQADANFRVYRFDAK